MVGEPEETKLGYRFNLERVPTPTLYPPDAAKVAVVVEFHTEHRLRVKVGYFCSYIYLHKP
jgi:hypothetical protein